jgi:hypothetical protein
MGRQNSRDDADDSTPNDRDDSPETDAYGRAIWSALNASALKAEEVREDASYAVLDRVAQSALERSALSGVRFDRAHTEVHSLLYYLVEETDRDMSAVSSTLDRLRLELLDETDDSGADDSEADEDDSPLLTDGGQPRDEADPDDADPVLPECVRCGYLPTGFTGGLRVIDASEVPADARETNRQKDLPETDLPRQGTVYVCEECYSGGDEDEDDSPDENGDDDSPLLTDGGGRETETEVETVEFKHRQPDSPDTLPGRGPELDPGETWADCSLCGYSGVVPSTTAFSADRLRCRSCSPEADSAVVEDEDEDDSPLLTDGGQPRDDADPNPDDADPDSPTLLRVRAVREETPSHVSVYYAVGPITFRADLRTALRNDDLVAPGEAFSLVRLVSYSPEQDPLDDDTQPADTHELTHVPPVVRGAVDRPVQVDVPPEFTEP